MLTIQEINAAMAVLQNKIDRAKSLKAYMIRHEKKMIANSSADDYSKTLEAIKDSLKKYAVEMNELKAKYSMNQIQ